MHAYIQWLASVRLLEVSDYAELWQWSVDEPEAFWESIWTYFDVISHGTYRSVCERPAEGMIGTRWFPGARLSYAEHIFRHRTTERPAVVFQSERTSLQALSWTELEAQVATVATWLRDAGVGVGDRVVSYLPNIPEALIAFLATNSLGAIWSSCSPDFGTASVVDRFQQIRPKVLFAVDGYVYNGRSFDRREAVQALTENLPTLEQVVMLPYLQGPEGAALPGTTNWHHMMQVDAAPLRFTPVPFDHPIWVLYSSGTTGKPKAITHSTGGILLEHLKALGLHQNCRPGDRFFWYSTTGWMMWNYANSALLTGGTLVIYDGAAAHPNLQVLWDLAEQAEITHFGGGAAFFISCMKAGLDLRRPWPQLQSIGSTGSPLPAEAFRWLYQAVKSDLWLISLSGGTDVCSGFVGGSPYLPVYAGEIQGRMLGCRVEAFNEAGQPVIDALGEMVITAPMPSMPIFFWGDDGHARYRSSYFDMYPGLWRHGDWIKITSRGSLIIYGRSDATLNRGGVRIGTAEVYSAVERLPEVADSLVVALERADGSYYMPLFVVLRDGNTLDEGLHRRIRQALREQYSPRHVPDEIFAAPAIPYTISGKKMEAPIKKLLMGTPWEQAASQDAMRNPEALAFFREFAAAFASGGI